MGASKFSIGCVCVYRVAAAALAVDIDNFIVPAPPPQDSHNGPVVNNPLCVFTCACVHLKRVFPV